MAPFYAKTLAMYSENRVKDAHTIIDLAMYNYEELKDLVNHRSYKLRKKLDLFLNWLFPKTWIPRYSMVTFTRMPYHQIVEDRRWQDKVNSCFPLLEHGGIFQLTLSEHSSCTGLSFVVQCKKRGVL
ncbi:hypothetical protein OSTOST_09657 [Ostertagia ostertagi]